MNVAARRRRVGMLAASPVLVILAACGGSNSPSTPPPATPTPTQTCPPGFAPGPVARYAIAPRAQVTDDRQVDMRVRARPGFDEVWCLDRSQAHRLDFNSNQRNAENKECCWENDPTWEVEDPQGLVSSHNVISGTRSFNYRIRVDPQNRTGTIFVKAQLDGKESYPWQSNSGYQQGPFRIVVMNAADIEKECTCIFKGNGQYDGDRCPK